MPMEASTKERDARLAFAWHAFETTLVGLLAITALIGLSWSWKRLPVRTEAEIDREIANRHYEARQRRVR